MSIDSFEERDKKRQKFQEYLGAKHRLALQELLQREDFRFYMSELLGAFKTFQNAFDEKGNVAAFNNGLQHAGQKIFEDIMSVNPEAFLKMRKEEEDLLNYREQMKV